MVLRGLQSLLGRLYDASDLKEDARALYSNFLARARRADLQRAFAERRLAALATAPSER